MINILMYIFLTISSFELFVGTFQMNGIQRNFFSLNRGVLENAITFKYDEQDGRVYANYDVETVKKNVKEYLTYTLKNYCQKFEVGFYFYFEFSKAQCRLDECSAVRISLKVPVTLFQTYENALSFELKEGR